MRCEQAATFSTDYAAAHMHNLFRRHETAHLYQQFSFSPAKQDAKITDRIKR